MTLAREVFAAVIGGLIVLAPPVNGQTADRGAADAALVERVKDAVIKELRESGALDRSVDAGVERYVCAILVPRSNSLHDPI